jgi:hypothetical protein
MPQKQPAKLELLGIAAAAPSPPRRRRISPYFPEIIKKATRLLFISIYKGHPRISSSYYSNLSKLTKQNTIL